jgi:DNA repair protein RadD
MKTLRDDQTAAIDKLRDAIREGCKRIVMQGATGYGKTIVAASIIQSARAKGKKILITVPTIALVDQTVQAFWDEGIRDVGVIQANHGMTDFSQPVQVASVQTLQRRAIPEADIVLIDECHVQFKFFEKLILGEDRREIITIGLSATPWARGMGKYYQRLIVVGTTADLIERDILSPFKVFAPSHPDLKGVRSIGGDYHEGDLADRMNKAKLTADIVETWKQRGENRPTICFAVNRAHAKALAEQFVACGIGAASMDCETPSTDRAAIRRAFLREEIKVVCNVDVIGTGVDWPEVSCVIYARPTKSEIRFVQNIGRALRRSDGKSEALIFDHSDTHLRLGFVTDIHYEELNNGAPALKDESEEPALPKECPQCQYLKPPRRAVCPNCGFKCEAHVKIEVNKGEALSEFTDTKKASKAIAKYGDKRTVYGMLSQYAARRSYKSGWAANKYRDLFGVWPRGMDDAPRWEPTPALASWIRSTQIRFAKGKARGNGNGESREARDEKIIANVRKQFVTGTLCTEDDLEAKW